MALDQISRAFIIMLTVFLVVLQNLCIAATIPEYTIVDLGTLGGGTSIAYAVNGQGIVVGKSETLDGYLKAFCWNPESGMREIGLGKALGLNDGGQVVGNIHHHTDDAFIWNALSGLTFLNKGDFLFATANGISASGKVVGYARRFNDVSGTMAVLWDPSADTIAEIGTLGGASYAYSINNKEEVLGNSGEPSRAFIWSDSYGMKDLGALNDEPWQYYGMDLNDEGQVVGYLKTDEDECRAFLWEAETGIRLLSGTGGSLALSINRHGHVVGAEGTIIGLEGKAYLWRDGQRIDLNRTIPVGSGWDLREARGISDGGQICGNGMINGKIHAFLLTPVLAVKPDIKANGSDTSITVSPTDAVSITVALDPSSKEGLNADWWIVSGTPFMHPVDWYSYVYTTGWSPGISVCLQTPLFNLSSFQVLYATLPAGNYTFYFALDDPDGEATGPWWGIDSVAVTVE